MGQRRQLWRETLGDDHPHTLSSAKFSLACFAVGEHEQARRLDEQTWSCFHRVLGRDDAHTLASASNLAADLRALGHDVNMPFE
jgi:hypothetical protein